MSEVDVLSWLSIKGYGPAPRIYFQVGFSPKQTGFPGAGFHFLGLHLRDREPVKWDSMAKNKAPLRHWREIAEEMRKEQDAKRRDELVRELDTSLLEEKRNRRTQWIGGRLILQGRDTTKK